MANKFSIKHLIAGIAAAMTVGLAAEAAHADPTINAAQATGGNSASNSQSASSAASAAEAKADGSSHNKYSAPVVAPAQPRAVVGQNDKYCVVGQDTKAERGPDGKKVNRTVGMPYWTIKALSLGGDRSASISAPANFGISLPWGGSSLKVASVRPDAATARVMCGGDPYTIEQPVPVAAAPAPVAAAPTPIVQAAPAPVAAAPAPIAAKPVAKPHKPHHVNKPAPKAAPKPVDQKTCITDSKGQEADLNKDGIVSLNLGTHTYADNTPTAQQVTDITKTAEAAFKANAAKAFATADQNHNGKVVVGKDGKFSDDLVVADKNTPMFTNALKGVNDMNGGKKALGFGMIVVALLAGAALLRNAFKKQPKKVKALDLAGVSPHQPETAKPAAKTPAAATEAAAPEAAVETPAAEKDKGITPGATGAAIVAAAALAASPYAAGKLDIRHSMTPAVSTPATGETSLATNYADHIPQGYEYTGRFNAAGKPVYTPAKVEVAAVEPQAERQVRDYGNAASSRVRTALAAKRPVVGRKVNYGTLEA